MNAQARDKALAAAADVVVEATSLIALNSQGRLLIIGDYAKAYNAAGLTDTLSRCLLVTNGQGESDDDMPVIYSQGKDISLSGHFGEFAVTVATEKGEANVAKAADRRFSHFDLILDLQDQPLMVMEVPPLGYLAPRDAEATQQAVAQLADLVGEFEKPKYFSYNAAICAHGRSGLSGCRRCIDACPTDAIKSLAEAIEVDPYYCQGGGSCATACPSGAIIYSYPLPADMANRIRVLLRTYYETGGSDAVLLFHDSEQGSEQLQQLAEPLPDNVIAIEVEEIGSVGMDTWFSALDYGAKQIVLLTTPSLPVSILHELQQQLDVARSLLSAMQYSEQAIDLLTVNSLHDIAPVMPVIEAARFAGSNEKRNALFFAIDWLHQQATVTCDEVALPGHALFGEIQVDRDACTLCMACVSVCPAAALEAGGDTPLLGFVEANCVQCGLCEIGCPEQAITRQARYVFDREQRMQRRTLNEEQPFNCISCGTPFATHSVIEKMTAKLAGHAMFQDAASVRRLQMCGDCKIRDMFTEENNRLM